ncbi:hypothetical protein TcasGA2_TC031728 [Tribolium castaneum]|uniref:Uncharacterized protein n=1 Tax=Tribolium castaneum TaxID=7070 RepID=A0A139W8J8_TRICA|nr:hypothetical protein TcasGA2_TC031728 [Tribolium castaneum]
MVLKTKISAKQTTTLENTPVEWQNTTKNEETRAPHQKREC